MMIMMPTSRASTNHTAALAVYQSQAATIPAKNGLITRIGIPLHGLCGHNHVTGGHADLRTDASRTNASRTDARRTDARH